MKKVLFFVLSLFLAIQPAYSADQWDKTDPAGTENASDIDALIIANNGVFDRLLYTYREGAIVSKATVATLSVSAGALALPNAAGTVVRWRRTTSATSVAWSDIDTGAEANSTTYYVYGVADADATTFTCVISTNASTPQGGETYYRRLASFYNDADGNIQNVRNDNDYSQKLGGYIKFNGSGTIAISKHFNVSSITDNGTGDYTITWDTDFSDANYACGYTVNGGKQLNITTQAAGSLRVATGSWDDGSSQDPTIVTIACFE